MICHSDLPDSVNATVDELMDYLYPRIFSTFIKLNPALERRARFFSTFFNGFKKNILANLNSDAPLQVLEVGSGTGKGSANNAEILKNIFKLVRYVAIDKREQLVSMTEFNLRSVLNTTDLSAATYVRDGLHGMSQNDLRAFGFKDGRVDVYFSEHSAYTELYDPNKAIKYLEGVKNILKYCGLALIVVQTEDADMQKLASRHIGRSSNYLQHIVNLELSLKALNYTVVAKYLNRADLTFPKLSSAEWSSIKTRDSNLGCFLNPGVEKALELMTFIKVPLNCLNNTELDVYVERLQSFLNQKNYNISNDEYIYAIFKDQNCSDVRISDNDGHFKITSSGSIPSVVSTRDIYTSESAGVLDSIMSSALQATTHGILRGSTRFMNEKLINSGVTKKSSFYLSQLAYYSGFFALQFAAHCQEAYVKENEPYYLAAMCNAALETGQLLFLNQALQMLDKLLERSEKTLEKKTNYSLLSKGVKLCRSVVPFSIFSNNKGIISTSAAIVVGGVAEVATFKSMNRLSRIFQK